MKDDKCDACGLDCDCTICGMPCTMPCDFDPPGYPHEWTPRQQDAAIDDLEAAFEETRRP